MTSRREFLERASWTMVPLATGLPAAVASATAPAVNRRAPWSLHAVLIDERHVAARTLGATLAGRRAPVRFVADDDITDLWLREIGPAWKRRPVALAGLTGSSTLFCLEQLAWVHRLRVVFHAEHVVLPSQAVSHSVQRRDASLAQVDERALAAAGRDWSGAIAEVFASWDPRMPADPAGPSCAGLEPVLPPGAVAAHLLDHRPGLNSFKEPDHGVAAERERVRFRSCAARVARRGGRRLGLHLR